MISKSNAPVSLALPPEFDPVFYRHSYADLAAISDTQLEDHYFSYGIKEGRVASPAGTRQNFLGLVPPSASVLEIGPFCNPCLVGDHVRYFDVLDKAGLISRAESIGLEHSRIPNIDYVSPTGDLSMVSERFDAVLSSHCIEHQPDLIRHLSDVARLLDGNGLYFLLIPDKRYCFDHFIRESTIADAIDAHFSSRTRHTIKSVIEHWVLITHNDPVSHWRGEHGTPILNVEFQRLPDAIEELRSKPDSYIDVHAWRFTPESFRNIIEIIERLGFAPMHVLRIYQTPFGSNEFFAILQRSCTDLLITNAEELRLAPSPGFSEEPLKVSTARSAFLHAELKAVRTECDAARKERAGWQAECEATTAELKATRAKVEALRNSWSWRVTAPLRWIRDTLVKLMYRARNGLRVSKTD
jgi:SAM-dependent methyltransferase